VRNAETKTLALCSNRWCT